MLGFLVCGPPAGARADFCAPTRRPGVAVAPVRCGLPAVALCLWLALGVCAPRSVLMVCALVLLSVVSLPSVLPGLPLGSRVCAPVRLAPAGCGWPRAPGGAPGVAALPGLVSPWARVALPAPAAGGAALSAGACLSACCAFLRPGAGGPLRPASRVGRRRSASRAWLAAASAFAPGGEGGYAPSKLGFRKISDFRPIFGDFWVTAVPSAVCPGADSADTSGRSAPGRASGRDAADQISDAGALPHAAGDEKSAGRFRSCTMLLLF